MDRAPLRELALRCHNLLEPLHAMVYFAPEAERMFTEAGLRAGRMSYFAGRAAPLGPVGPGVVTATFYSFSPALVARHIPKAWDAVAPAEVVTLRFRVAETALRRLLGDAADSPEVVELGALLREAALAASPEGRPLFAAHADLEWPDDPILTLWHGATLLREFRGDGHLAALVAEGLSGLAALITHTATGQGFRAEVSKELRGWSDDEWAAAEDDLRVDGFLDTEGRLTERGRRQREVVEERTTAASLAPYRALGEQGAHRVAELARPLARTALKAGAIPRDLFSNG